MDQVMAVNRPLTGNCWPIRGAEQGEFPSEWPLMAVKKTLTDNILFIFNWLLSLFSMAVNGRYWSVMSVNGQCVNGLIVRWPLSPLMAVKKWLTAIKSMNINDNFFEKLAVNLSFALTVNNPFGIKYLMAVNGKIALTVNNPFGIKYLMAVKMFPLKGECFLNGHSHLGVRQPGAHTPQKTTR